jgi:hypothetical protein
MYTSESNGNADISFHCNFLGSIHNKSTMVRDALMNRCIYLPSRGPLCC